jgi:hypothetical protein
MRSYIGEASTSRPRDGFVLNPKLKLVDQVSEIMRPNLILNHHLLPIKTTIPAYFAYFALS